MCSMFMYFVFLLTQFDCSIGLPLLGVLLLGCVLLLCYYRRQSPFNISRSLIRSSSSVISGLKIDDQHRESITHGQYRDHLVGLSPHYHDRYVRSKIVVKIPFISLGFLRIPNIRSFIIREDINEEKKTFSFGHCPNEEWGGSTHARIFWPFFKKCIFGQ